MAEGKLVDRFKNAWDAFKDPTPDIQTNEISYSRRPDVRRLNRSSERSIVATIWNQIAIDVSQVSILHVRTDENGMYTATEDSALNRCLTDSANLDQTGRALIQDAVLSMFDEGCVAIVPVVTDYNPRKTRSYDIEELRTGKITQWYPRHVEVELYNERTGLRQTVTLPKSMVAIVENPFYSVMNMPNSTLRRLIDKLALLDRIDQESGAGKLNMIIQLPYTVKNPARQKQAEERRRMIEQQLANSKFGIAYADATERITQINRPLENNLLDQVQYLTSTLYSQLGLTEDVFKGTASEAVMLNYYNRTIEPILSAFCTEMKRKFLTQTAITQRQTIKFFKDPFKLASVTEIAGIADTFTRNAILTSNEMRGIIGYKPIDDPRADELSNKNLYDQMVPGMETTTEEVPTDESMTPPEEQYSDYSYEQEENQNG